MEGGGGVRGVARGAARAGLRPGGEGRAFLFRGLCPGLWDKNAKPARWHPLLPATQRLAEGRAADGDLPCP